MLRLTTPTAAVLAMTLLGLESGVAIGQQLDKPSIAIVVLSPIPLKDGHAVVQRRAAAKPHNPIVLDAGASAADLTADVQTLSGMRSHFGAVPQRDLRAGVKGAPPSAKWIGSRDEAEKRELLHDLSTARFRDVPGIGHVRGFPITIPATSGLDRSKM